MLDLCDSILTLALVRLRGSADFEEEIKDMEVMKTY